MSRYNDLPGVGVSNLVLQETIGAYSHEAYTNARKLSSTAIVSGNDQIDKDTETFIGQLRWYKPMNPTINVASLTDASDGTKTTYSSDYLSYIKTVRTHGAEKVNMAKVVTQEDGLAKIGRDFGETKAQDEHNAVMAVLKGVAISEALNGAATGSGATGLGGQTFDNDPTDKKYGFYIDLGASTLVGAASASSQGAARAESFLNAVGMAYKDYEPDFMYLITSPALMAQLRSANLVDQDKVTDGNVEFSTIFDGKFRLISSRAATNLSSADLTKINTGAGVDIVGTKTSYLVLPGALAMEALDVPDETEITRDGNKYKGGGLTSIWYRWGYVLHPAGYNWNGSQEAFPSDTDYTLVTEDSRTTFEALAGVTTIANARGNWQRKASSALSLGILPIFHS
jgi:hypothetical protein